MNIKALTGLNSQQPFRPFNDSCRSHRAGGGAAAGVRFRQWRELVSIWGVRQAIRRTEISIDNVKPLCHPGHMHHLVGVAEVAEALGVSKQRIVQIAQTYSDFPDPEVELSSGRIWARSAIETWLATHPERKPGPKGGNIPMLENFTTEARRAYVRAQAEAAEWGHNYLGCEHLIIGLAGTEGIACRALKDEGVTPESAATQLGSIIGRGTGSDGKVKAFTPRLKRAAELAAEAAREFGHNYVGTEHILIGILREGDNVGCRLLTDLGVDLDRLRFRTLELMGFPQPRNPSVAITTSMEDTVVARVVELLESMNKRLETLDSRLG